MIKIKPKKGIKLNDPKNLTPIVFRCQDCGCLIRKIEATNSYILFKLSKEVEDKKKRLCKFCRKLFEYRGVEDSES